MAVGRYKEKRLPERLFEYEKKSRRIEPEPYMHNEPIYYGNSSISSGSLVMPANWTYTTSSANTYIYNGSTTQYAPPPPRELTPMEWLDEQVNAVCRRSGL